MLQQHVSPQPVLMQRRSTYQIRSRDKVQGRGNLCWAHPCEWNRIKVGEEVKRQRPPQLSLCFFFRFQKTAGPTWKKESHCFPPCSTTGTSLLCLSTLLSNRKILLFETGKGFLRQELPWKHHGQPALEIDILFIRTVGVLQQCKPNRDSDKPLQASVQKSGPVALLVSWLVHWAYQQGPGSITPSQLLNWNLTTYFT